MSETAADWHDLDGLDPAAATFPARAKVAGERILVFRVGDGFRGVDAFCPHMHQSLIDARIVGNGTMLRCMHHIYTFRVSDGNGVNCPGFRLKVYEIKQEDGRLFARPAN